MFAALSSTATDTEIHTIGRRVGGTVYTADPENGGREMAFSSVVIAKDSDALESVCDVALFEVDVRQIRHQPRTWDVGQPTPGVVAVFGMVGRPDLTHGEVDDHWRDIHAPLALAHHPGMWHYHQVSVSEVVKGRAYDGIALCAFASQYDLRQRFFTNDESRRIIRDDVSQFCDTTNSPRRVLMTEYRYNPRQG